MQKSMYNSGVRSWKTSAGGYCSDAYQIFRARALKWK